MNPIYHIPKGWMRRSSGLIAPSGLADSRIEMRGIVVISLLGPDGKLKDQSIVRNLITNDGDIWYAQRSGGETTSETFQTGIMELGTAGNAITKAIDRSDMTAKLTPTKTVTFKTNETDVDNGGAGGVDILTFFAQWAPGEATDAAITHVLITNAAPNPTENVLMMATGFTKNKTAPDTLKAFVNHEFLGV